VNLQRSITNYALERHEFVLAFLLAGPFFICGDYRGYSLCFSSWGDSASHLSLTILLAKFPHILEGSVWVMNENCAFLGKLGECGLRSYRPV
jgi:hypothetical protein